MEESANSDPKNSRKKRLIRNLFVGALFAMSVLLITLHSLMNNPNKPGGSYMYVGSVKTINRYQQAYYLERGKFASSLEELNLPVDLEAKGYIFFTVNFRQAVFNYGILGTGSAIWESYKHCLQWVSLHIVLLVIATKISQSSKFLALQQERL